MKIRKIINDPVYGFVTIPDQLIITLIEHPYFQRLRRIEQLGLSHMVYPGAHHTRFHHAIGAMHLMDQALHILEQKGTRISNAEKQAALAAILLHDIGHGPFSHALEHSIVEISHEDISRWVMNALNKELKGQLDLAIQIFENKYPRRFFHQLVSSQLDVDRLDYLMRDSFFSGVSEGVIGYSRIIKMMTCKNDELVIEQKAIHSIEKFLVSRRLMYWQVYLHKTVLAAEHMLTVVLLRARELFSDKISLEASPGLMSFLKEDISKEQFFMNHSVLESFMTLDDSDIYSSLKLWQKHPDYVLRTLSFGLINRRLLKIRLQKNPFDDELLNKLRKALMKQENIGEHEAKFLVFQDRTSNHAYNLHEENINIINKDGTLLDIGEASDQMNFNLLSKPVVKSYICFPAQLTAMLEKNL